VRSHQRLKPSREKEAWTIPQKGVNGITVDLCAGVETLILKELSTHESKDH
jgi:hypothetical protein